MGKAVLWENDFNDWKKVSVEAYQFVIEQSKERLDEVISESRTIISRSMTILVAYIAIFSGIIGFIFSERNKAGFDFLTIIGICLLAIFSIFIFTLLFALIASKYIAYKGSSPKEILRQEILQHELPEVWFKAFLYEEISRIQDKIENIQALNRKRREQFRAILKVSLIFATLFVLALLRKALNATWEL